MPEIEWTDMMEWHGMGLWNYMWNWTWSVLADQILVQQNRHIFVKTIFANETGLWPCLMVSLRLPMKRDHCPHQVN